MNEGNHFNEDAVRAKAYELWQLRGCPEGSALEDWEQAERLLREEVLERTATASALGAPTVRESGVAQSDRPSPAVSSTASREGKPPKQAGNGRGSGRPKAAK